MDSKQSIQNCRPLAAVAKEPAAEASVSKLATGDAAIAAADLKRRCLAIILPVACLPTFLKRICFVMLLAFVARLDECYLL